MYVSTVPTPFMSQDEYDTLDEHDRAEYDRQRADLESAVANKLATAALDAIDAAIIGHAVLPGLPHTSF